MQSQNEHAHLQCGKEPDFEAILTARLHRELFSKGYKVWLEGAEGNPRIRALVDPDRLRIHTRVPPLETLKNQTQKIVDEYFDGLTVQVISGGRSLAFILDGNNPAQQLRAKLEADGPGKIAQAHSGENLAFPSDNTWGEWLEARNSRAGIDRTGRE